ncbi:hypothetical protein TCAL_00873 [Tigriopus californicus]|uniref:type I protein arginine methyltransferase n=1 Tax=Tigriopus californicus TaxID=6832 RepID=A0A553NDC9_TIGCA|nr:uncharacterized protein LOC131889591 [Tigriopus californicus]TRY63454.1 hypothetical protein TCAL_00873 [Tigriopus californicus]
MSRTDDPYFKSYFNLEVHRLMLQDKPRTEAYQQAIVKNAPFFKDKTVMDIGAGTGILSMFCAQAGAQKVYAVEASAMATPLREIVVANQFMNTITVLEGKAEDIDLPNHAKVDIIVSEWMGFYLLHESMLDSVIAARDKHLAPHGIMMPSHARIWSAPVSMSDYFREKVDFWDNVYGFKMPPLKRLMLRSDKPEVDVIQPEQILSEPTLVAEFDLRWVETEEIKSVSQKRFISATATGSFQGLALWFDCDFRPFVETEWVTCATLSTSPSCPSTHWKQTIIVLPVSTDIEQDEVIGWSLTLTQTEGNARHYAIQLEVLDPAVDEHPTPCGCQMAKCALIKALMEKEEEALN